MPFTQAQLTTFFTNSATGVAPNSSQQLALQALAAQNASGSITDDQARQQSIALGANTSTAVGVEAYQFFTGTAPSQDGLKFLNAAYATGGAQAGLNGENRFIAQSVSLALGNTAAKTSFSTLYGSLSVADATKAAYEIIIGTPAATAAGINVANAVAFLSSAASQTYFTNFVKANVPGLTAAADIDLAVKAAIVGEIMYAATTFNNNAGVGNYAVATKNLLTDLSDDGALVLNNAAGINLLTAYGVGGGGAPSTPGSTFALTGGIDTLNGTANDDTFTGVVIAAGTPTTQLFTTLQAADTIIGGPGNDTLNINVLEVAGGATGNVGAAALAVGSQGVEIINVRNTSSNAADTTTIAANNYAGATQINLDRTAGPGIVTGLVSGQAVGIIGNAAATNGSLTATYTAATPTANSSYTAGLNLTGGMVGAPVVVLAAGGAAGGIATVNINSATAANTIGTLTFGTGQAVVNTVRTINVVASSNLTTGAVSGFGGTAFGTNTAVTTGTLAISGTGSVTFGGISGGGDAFTTLNITTGTGAVTTGDIAANVTAAGATINVSGGATTTTPATGSVNLGLINADVVKLDASGLTNGGIQATLGATVTQGFIGGQGVDVITLGAVAGGTVNGGAGTDIIAFTDGTFLTSALTPLVLNFETLRVGGTAGVAFDPTLISGITSYQISAGTGVTINNLVANPSVTVIGAQAGTTTLNLQTAAGTSDVVNLRLDNLGTAASGANQSGVTVNALALGGNGVAGQIETLNLTSAGRVAGTGTYNAVTLAASGGAPNYADANTVNVLGSVGVTLTTGNSAHAQKIDASAHTGGVSIVNTTAGTGPFTIIGSAVNDTINSSNTATIYGGGGGDRIVADTGTIQTIVYKAGSDSQIDLAGTAALTGAAGVGASGTATLNTSKMDIIQGFDAANSATSDKIDVSTFAFTGALGGGIVDKGLVASDAAFTTLLTTAGLFTDGVTQRGIAVINGSAAMSSGVAGTFVIIDTNKDGAYTAGTDIVIKLTGINGALDITDFTI